MLVLKCGIESLPPINCMTKRERRKRDNANLWNQAHIIYRFSAFKLDQENKRKGERRASQYMHTDNLVLLSFWRQRAVIAVICFYALVSRFGDSYCTHINVATVRHTDCKLSLMIIMKMMSSACRNNNTMEMRAWTRKFFTSFCKLLIRNCEKIIYRSSVLIEDDAWGEPGDSKHLRNQQKQR